MRKGTYLRLIATKRMLESKIKNNMKIIDLGGYDGTISSYLKQKSAKANFLVVDNNKKALDIAKKKGLETLYSDATNMKIILNKSIDLVLCLDLLEHVENDKLLIFEISRILKKDGILFLTTPMKNGVRFPFVQRKINKKINRLWGHKRLGYSIEEIKKLFIEKDIIIESRGKYFNWFSRLAYFWLDYFRIIPKFVRTLVFKLVVSIEPYIKIGSSEYIIIGRKIEK